MELSVGTRVRFVEQHRPRVVRPEDIGVIVSVEQSTTPWQPRVRVRFENYLSGWIWQNVLVPA
jgi:hypothetical protein